MNTFTTLSLCSAATVLLAAGPASAVLVFDNGGDNTFNTVSAVPVVVEDDANGNPTTLNVEDGADIDDPEPPFNPNDPYDGINGDTAMEVRDFSIANISGGIFRQDLDAEDNSTVNITGGTFEDDIYVIDSSRVTMSGGSVDEDVYVEGNGEFTLSGGSVGEEVYVRNNSQFTMSGGSVGEDVNVRGNSRAVFDGGVVNESVEVRGTAELTVNTAEILNDLIAQGNAVINFFDGSVADDVEAYDDAVIYLSGGSFGEDIEADLGGTIDISGGELFANGVGTLGVGFGVDGDGRIILRGPSFFLDGSPIGPGLIVPDTGLLSGTLLDGSTFSDIPFTRDLLPQFDDRGIIEIVIIPEPASLVLLALGAAVAAPRRRRR